MVYRLYVETVERSGKIGWSYAFYNHQNFMVYKRFGNCESTDLNKVILETSVTALSYFERSIRRRYYDEHFSTRIDEDYVTLFTQYPEIAEVAQTVKNENALSLGFIGENKALWETLLPFLTQRTMLFENATEEKFILLGKDLAEQGLNK